MGTTRVGPKERQAEFQSSILQAILRTGLTPHEKYDPADVSFKLRLDRHITVQKTEKVLFGTLDATSPIRFDYVMIQDMSFESVKDDDEIFVHLPDSTQ